MSDFDNVKDFLKNVKNKDINFKNHFYEKVENRPISEKLVRKYLKKVNNLLGIEKQLARKEKEEKYKLWIKLSRKYNLVVICTIHGKNLNIISSWNTNKKWKEKK